MAQTTPVQTPRPAEPDEYVFTGGRRPSFRASIRELVAYRECVFSFASRSLRVRYKQALLGLAWAVIQPLVFLGIFILFFNAVAGVQGNGATYAAFALSALVPWQFVSNGVTFGGQSLIQDASALLRKVYFPREAPVLGAILAYIPDLLIGLVLILIAVPLTGAHIGSSIVVTPLLCALIILPAVAVSMPIAALAVYYRDFKYALPFLVQLWMFASPVAYPITTVAAKWRPLYAALNPVVGPLDAFSHVFASGTWPDWGLLAISAASSTFLLVVGYRIFKNLEREIADVV